jgi:hypothetical protein
MTRSTVNLLSRLSHGALLLGISNSYHGTDGCPMAVPMGHEPEQWDGHGTALGQAGVP